MTKKQQKVEFKVKTWRVPSKYDNKIRITEFGSIELPKWFCNKYPGFDVKEDDELKVVIRKDGEG